MKNILFHSGEFIFNAKGFPNKPGELRYDYEEAEYQEVLNDYERALQFALAGAVKFADQEAIRIAICELQLNKGPDYYQFKPVEGQTFFVAGVTVKEWYEPLVSQSDIVTGRIPIGTDISKFCKVAVLSNRKVKSETPETGKQKSYQEMLKYLISIRDSAAEAGELSFLPQAINTMTDIITRAINHSEYDR